DLRHSDQHELFAFSTLARNRDERGFPGGRRTLDTLRQTGRDSQSIALSDNLVISSHAVNSARFQFSRLMPADAPSADNPVVIIDIDDPRDRNSNANPLTRSGRLTAGASTLGGVDRREDRYQFQDTLSYAYRAHTLRIGCDIQLIYSRFIDLEDSTGTFTFATPADFLANQPSRYLHRFKNASELHNNYQGVYIQDDWRILPNLSLSIGLRWDNETILKDRNNFGPRLSFAWDPLKSNKTVVRAGYGIFYNRALLRTLDDFILTSNATLVDTNNEAAKRLLSELQFPSVMVPSDQRIKETGVRESGFIRRLSRDFRIPESYQASFGFERQIDWNSKIEVNYVFNRGLHLWREVNANAPQPPADFGDFTDYLTSRDFDNRRDPVTGNRPITNTGNADTVRFTLSETPSETLREGLGRVIVFGLNNPSTSNLTSGMNAALAVIRSFRPDPKLTQIEELQSRGNSSYHGVSFEYQRRMTTRGFARASYTLSKLIDDGVVNTSSPLIAGDFRRERTLSLMDSRHRIAASGFYEFPDWLLRLNLAGTFNFTTSRPFNIGANGNDRNLDDVDNDRPNFIGNLDSIRWRRPGTSIDQGLFESFSLPVIGSSGNLGRNAGRGPNTYSLNLRVSRPFHYRGERKFEVRIEVFNPFNTPVFSYGAEFVDYTPSASGDFLAPRRTIKPRTMRVGLKFEF
ncbi:MAG: TonB-dependent receptor, partial [Acidobacteria bacterium]|nr:TonB-dependent receptor [Acidobacteriota bacterium]